MTRSTRAKITIIITSLLVAALAAPAFAISAKEIIKRAEEATRGDTAIAVYEITVKSRRWTRTMEMKSYENRLTEKSMAEIYAPKKDAGNKFLLKGDNMWHYVPKLQKTIKIAPSMMLQSWMGSDFTNDDIVNMSSIVDDYHHSLLGTETMEGQECYKVQLKPKENAAVVWGKIIYYARTKDYLPVRQEFYNEHGVMKKVMTCSDFQVMDGRTIPTRYKMNTVRKKDQYTVMDIKKIRFNVSIPSYIFTIQYLKRK